MNDWNLENRVKAIRRLTAEKRADCLVLTGPANVTYVTGFSGGDSWALISPRAVHLITDSRYVEQADSQCRCRIIARTGSLAEAAAKVINRLKSVRRVALEKSACLHDFQALKKTVAVRLTTPTDIVETARLVKDETEIAAVRDATKIAVDAFGRAKQAARPGVTENELAGVVDFEIRKGGGASSFDTIVAFGSNASRPHHQPGKSRLKKRDTVLIDFGVKYNNYCCDLTRCFAVGRPSVFYREVYEAVLQAQAAAIKLARPGAEIRQLDAAARETIRSRGLAVYGHGTGHGLGLQVHEGPVISGKSGGKLEAGMIFTIEPGVYIPGKLGVRIEDDILVTEDGCTVLSRSLAK